MPRVPTYDGSQVRTAPLPGVRVPQGVPTRAFLPAEPVDIASVTNLIAQIRQEEIEKADQLAVTEADAQLSKLETELLYDPNTGALNRKGKDAFSSPEDVREAWTKRVGEIGQGLTTDRQKRAFERVALGRSVQVDRTVQRHVTQEMERHDQAVTESYLANERDAAILNASDPERVAIAVSRIKSAISAHAKRNGMPSEWVEDKAGEAVSSVHAGVIARLLTANRTDSAKAYFAAHQGELGPDDLARAEGALEQATTDGTIYREVDRIMQSKDLTEEKAFAQARALEDPKVRQGVTRELENEFRRREAMARDASEARFKSAFDYANQGRRPPAPLWDALTPSQQVSIDSRIAQLSRSGGRGSGGEETDWGVYYRLKIGAGQNREEFMKLNLLEARPYLGDTEFKELVKLQTDLRGGDDTSLRGFMSDNAIVQERIDKLYPNAKKGNEDDDKANAFRREVEDEVMRWKQETGKSTIPTTEMRRIVDEKAIRSVFIEKRPGPSGFMPFGIELPLPSGERERGVTEVKEDERGRAYVPYDTIPEDAREEIETIIRNRSGRIRSRRQVERAFAARRIGDRSLFNAIIAEGTGGGSEF